MTIHDLQKKYLGQIAPLDLELLFSFVLNKPREFVLAHPEQKIIATHNSQLDSLIKRRTKGEPIAYLIGKKEFYGLEFSVNKNTLIPRPETELLVELALGKVRSMLRSKLRSIKIVDVGTGSGNILISIAHNIKHETYNNTNFYGIDISRKALLTAKKNARNHKLNQKVKFIHGNLLDPIIKNCSMLHVPCLPAGRQGSMIILANLPYLSSEIYSFSTKDVRLYEPKTALYSPQKGLNHYIKLLKQLAKFPATNTICYLEISPEQKPLLSEIIKRILPSAKIVFRKDLSGKWRVCQVEI
jgi:release factor glutamine methyltransferase